MSNCTEYAKTALGNTEGEHPIDQTNTWASLAQAYASVSIAESLEEIAGLLRKIEIAIRR